MLKFFVFCFGYLLYPISFIIPRNKNKWAFGSMKNQFDGNSKYLFIHLSRTKNEVEIVWLSTSKKTTKQINDYGLKSYYVGSIKGILYAFTSKYWFFNGYTSDILFFASGNAVCINLWHGVGLKKTEFSIKEGKLSERYVTRTLKERFYHPECFRKPDFLLSSTDFQSVKFAEAFRIDISRCLNLGYPRNTFLLADEDIRKQFILEYESKQITSLIELFKNFDKIFIYMPTWRDNQRDVFVEQFDLNVINKLCREKNILMLLKPHSNTKVDNIYNFENIKLINSGEDIYSILPYTDVLITDYSSVLYDYVLMENKNSILYLYDYEYYMKNNRDFNYPFLENVAGKVCYNFEQLIQCIKDDDYVIDNREYQKIITKFWGESWNKSIKQLSEEIILKTIEK